MKIRNIIIRTFVLMLIVGLASCSISNSAAKKKSLEKGLIAYYPFNGNALDESDYNHDGDVRGAKLGKDRNGIKDNAYVFDGINDHIYISDSKILQLKNTLTISVWFKTNDVLPYAGIVCKSEAQEPRHGYIISINPQKKGRTDILNDHSKKMQSTLSSNTNLIDNEWHHIIATYDGQKHILYIDGNLESQRMYNDGLQISRTPLLIGWDMSTWKSHRHFKGSIDDIRIYNRALSSEEVSLLFNEK